MTPIEGPLNENELEKLIEILKTRFEKNRQRHRLIEWNSVKRKIEDNYEKLESLYKMEITGGEPDIVDYDRNNDEYIFMDCSIESPIGRRNLCYDKEAQLKREKKGLRLAGNVIDMAKEIGIQVLNWDQYLKLQSLGSFDNKTQSWILTPIEIRRLGGALFADRRYGHVFLYHNSAWSFYKGRGFRGMLRV
ncbi:MAG TPA: DUF4256 domain-containing protein [Geobacterales bacterium]|nr:DUF4256 domain-containing protein [Geobacterales bacterium]